MRAEYRLRVFENGALRETYGSEKDGSDWRIPQNVQLHDLYRSSSIIRVIKFRRMRWVGHVARRVYRVLVGTLEGNDSVWPRYGWGNNTVIDTDETEWEGVEWVNMDSDMASRRLLL